MATPFKSLWSVQRSQDIHKATEASDSLSSRERGSPSPIHRRNSDNGKHERESNLTSHPHPGYPGILTNYEILWSIQDRLSRFSGQFCSHGYNITSGKDTENNEGGPVTTTEPDNHSQPFGKDNRNPELMRSSSNTSLTTLPRLANGQEWSCSLRNQQISLSQPAKAELQWWYWYLTTHNGKPIRTPHPDLVIYMDASLWGWGATSQGAHIGGAWTPKELDLHINCLELLRAWNSVQAFCQKRENITVLIWLDNSSAVASINHMGCTRSSMLASITVQHWTWAL